VEFDYRALNGEGQIVTGSLQGLDERAVARTLRHQGLTPVSLQSRAVQRPRKPAGRIKPADTLLVIQQLATLLRSGVPIDEAIDSLAEAVEQPGLKFSLAEILLRIRRGNRFSEALEQVSLDLPVYILQLAKAGELTGNLAGALSDGAAQMAYEQRIATELRSALIYPSILVVSGIAAVLLIFTLVVPRFASLLNKSHADIPWLAQAVLETGGFFNQHPDLIGGILLVLLLLGITTWRNAHARQRLWDVLTRFPLIGPWLMETDTGRWAAMLSTLLSSRVELTQALRLAQEGVKSSRLRANLAQVTKAVRAGTSLSRALQESQAITATGLGLVRVGEKSGELPAMLRSLADMYIDYGRERMKRFLTLLEPMAILLIGGVIGVIMTGIILAITSVNDISI
jgi:general secretion pathway protein F